MINKPNLWQQSDGLKIKLIPSTTNLWQPALEVFLNK
jgi:hypothetical protein